MRACIREITGRIEYAIEWEGKTAKDVRERMDEIMAARGEGLVIKHPDSEYVLNGRNKDWIKVRCFLYFSRLTVLNNVFPSGQTRVHGPSKIPVLITHFH